MPKEPSKPKPKRKRRLRVVFAFECSECECCGEPVCPICKIHYADCPHPGPMSEDEDE